MSLVFLGTSSSLCESLVFGSVVVQTASGWTIRGRVNGYVPIPEIIDRVKLLDELVLVRVYMRIRLIHILRFHYR